MNQYINTKDIRNIFEHLTDEYAYTEFLSGIYVAKSWIEDIKPADAEPVRHGRWIEQGAGYNWSFVCSQCGHIDGFPFNERMKYCPNCGAKMDGEVEE